MTIDRDNTQEPAAVLESEIAQFFKEQPLLSDFHETNRDKHNETLLNNGNDVYMANNKGVTRRKSFHELEYLYRAAKLQSKLAPPTSETTALEFGVSRNGDKHKKIATESRSQRQDHARGKPHTRHGTSFELTPEEQELRDEALYRSLIHMFEIQARLEDEEANASLLHRAGRLFGFRSRQRTLPKAELPSNLNAANNAMTASTNDDRVHKSPNKRTDRKLQHLHPEAVQIAALETAATNENGIIKKSQIQSAEQVRTFASMFSLPSLFRSGQN